MNVNTLPAVITANALGLKYREKNEGKRRRKRRRKVIIRL